MPLFIDKIKLVLRRIVHSKEQNGGDTTVTYITLLSCYDDVWHCDRLVLYIRRHNDGIVNTIIGIHYMFLSPICRW